MSASAVFLATAICASGVRCTWRSFPSRDFTDRTSPFNPVMVPRTRTLGWANATAATSERASRASDLMGSSLYAEVNSLILRRIPMLNPFQEIKKIEVRRFTALPAKFRDKRRSEEHTSELQSHSDLVCRLLLEKKKNKEKDKKEETIKKYEITTRSKLYKYNK